MTSSNLSSLIHGVDMEPSLLDALKALESAQSWMEDAVYTLSSATIFAEPNAKELVENSDPLLMQIAHVREKAAAALAGYDQASHSGGVETVRQRPTY